MARKFDVIEADGRPGPQMKKSAALLLVRRLVAILEPGKPFTIRKLRIYKQPAVLEKCVQIVKPRPRPEYQHHIEPRIEHIPQMDRLVAEWRCAKLFWNEA